MDAFLDRMNVWRAAYRNECVDIAYLSEGEAVQFDVLVGRGMLNSNGTITAHGFDSYEAIANMYSIVFEGVLNR